MEILTKDQAIDFSKKEACKYLSFRKRAELQMTQDRLCMPFDVFHEAIEKTLGRPVYTHEFGLNVDGLKNELFNGAEPPSFEDIMNLIPKNKRVILVT